MLPNIFADKIVWQDSRNNSKPADRDIYIFSITRNGAPLIEYPIPDHSPEITEGESLSFIIEADDPDGDALKYEWFLNDQKIPDNDTNVLKFTSEFGMSGIHSIKVIISDSEYDIEHIWTLTITESGIEPIEILWIEPSKSPQIIEGDEVAFRLKAKYRGSQEPDVSWIFPIEDIPSISPISSGSTTFENVVFAEASVRSHLEPNGSYFVSEYDITVLIKGEGFNLSYTWKLSVIYLEDADFDGYSDSLEILRNSDPEDGNSIPTDTDSDLIVDADDDDIDGDGFLGKYDADDTNPNKQLDGEPANLPEILIIIISIILLVASVISLSKASKR